MLDYNSTQTFADQVNAHIDEVLVADNQRQTPRQYLGGSRLGVACERALQFEYAQAPKDDGRDFNGQTLRIFAAGHVFEDLAIDWLRHAGFELNTTKGNTPGGEQFGFSVAGGRIRGHVDGIINAAPVMDGFPALWECKSLNNKSWNDTVKRGVTVSKPVYAAQIATYQAYMETSVPGISQNPALFTAINKDTAELHHELVPFDGGLAQRMSDKAHLRPRCIFVLSGLRSTARVGVERTCCSGWPSLDRKIEKFIGAILADWRVLRGIGSPCQIWPIRVMLK